MTMPECLTRGRLAVIEAAGARCHLQPLQRTGWLLSSQPVRRCNDGLTPVVFKLERIEEGSP